MKLKVALAQISVVRSDPEANLAGAEPLVAQAAGRGSSLICFPEMWTTGFDWKANRRLAPGQEKTIARVGQMARRHRLWLNGSLLALDEAGRIANTSVLFNPAGEQVALYRKAHLFSLLHEDKHMAPGNSLGLAQTPWGKAGLSVCYDIRFPELFRTYALLGAEFVLSSMAFPHPRLEHWRILVRARAIENQMFMIGTNQVGTEDFGPEGRVTYFGHSCVIDPWGETVAEAGEGEELLTAEIDLDRVREVRRRMKVFRDRRPDLYRL